MIVASSPLKTRPFAFLNAIFISFIFHLFILVLLRGISSVSSAPVPKRTTVRLMKATSARASKILVPAQLPCLHSCHISQPGAIVAQPNSAAGQIQTPPTPKKAYKVPIEYPEFAADLNIEGSIIVVMEITNEGKIKKAYLKKKLGFGLDEFVLAKIRQFEFEPAMNFQGQTVDSIFEHEVRFELD
jgi:outer membrane biosynthesis protein TonB